MIEIGPRFISLPRIESAIREVCQTIGRADVRIPMWERMTEDDLWRELVACILGSRTRFEDAYAALERMSDAGLLSRERRSSRYREYERDVMYTLQGHPASPRNFAYHVSYPLSRVRSSHIREAAERLYAEGETIRGLLDGARSALEARRRL